MEDLKKYFKFGFIIIVALVLFRLLFAIYAISVVSDVQKEILHEREVGERYMDSLYNSVR